MGEVYLGGNKFLEGGLGASRKIEVSKDKSNIEDLENTFSEQIKNFFENRQPSENHKIELKDAFKETADLFLDWPNEENQKY